MGRSISAINIKTRDVTRIEWYIRGCESVAQSLCVQTTARTVREIRVLLLGDVKTRGTFLVIFMSNLKLSSRIQLPRGSAHGCLLTEASEATCDWQTTLWTRRQEAHGDTSTDISAVSVFGYFSSLVPSRN